MILDTSAIIAIFFREADWQALLSVLEETETIGVGAPTLAECGIVLGARRGFNGPHLHRFIQEFGVQVTPFGELHWSEAVRAYARYGRGQHPAKLNFGDCLSYATAKLAQQPLLCKGEDFTQTDLMLVDYRGTP